MRTWPDHPVVYEINTWVWLGELSRKYRKSIDLATVPEQEWDTIASYGFNALWFMGVWERSPAGIGISLRNKGLLEDFRRALPDFSTIDMPEMNGYELTTEIRHLEAGTGHRTPIFAITASDFDLSAERAKAFGFSGYMLKPLDLDVLERKLSEP